MKSRRALDVSASARGIQVCFNALKTQLYAIDVFFLQRLNAPNQREKLKHSTLPHGICTSEVIFVGSGSLSVKFLSKLWLAFTVLVYRC